MRTEKTPAELRRSHTLITAVVILAVGIGLGVTGSRLIRSPEAAALEEAAPSLPSATATVEEGVLGDSLVVDAVFASSGDQLIPSADIDGVVTSAPSLDGGVAPGAVVLEVSGRPVFVISGGATVYRDFVGGIRGTDVVALQQGLTALGYDVGPVDGVYGPQTAAAVRAFYVDAGYDPPAAAASPAEVAVANAQVASASATLRNLDAAAADPADIAVAVAALALSRESLITTRDASLTPFPAGELVFVEGNSYNVVVSGATVGSPATRGVIVLASGSSRTLWASVPRTVAARLTVGTPVTVTSALGEVGSEGFPGAVAWIASSIGVDGVRDRFGDSFAVPSGQVGLEITLDAPLTRADAGQLRATIAFGAENEPTLIVPLSAIRTSADGRTTVAVQVQGASGEFEFRSVEVTVLDTLSGRVSVRSTDLQVGDHVAIP